MQSSIGLFALFLAVCTAQVPNFGGCPGYVPMSNFDIERFLGKWYEAERYFQVTELGSRCVVSDYARSPNGKISVSNEVTSRITGIKRILGGDMELNGRTGEGKLKVKYETSPIRTTISYSVLDTDYDNFAVMWSCSGYGPFHTQNAWVMTRERLAAADVMQKAYGVLDKYKISRNFFQKTDQEGCVLAASEINAAQGWIGEQAVTDPPQTVEKAVDPLISEKSAGLDNQPEVTQDKGPKEEELPSEPKPALKEEQPATEKKIKKPVEIAEHILKQNPVEDTVKLDKVKEKHIAAKAEAEGVLAKKAESKKVSPKVVHSQKNVAKTK